MQPGAEPGGGGLEMVKNRLTKKINFVETSMLDISSSEIRKTINNADFNEDTLDGDVYEYIKKNSLYKN